MAKKRKQQNQVAEEPAADQDVIDQEEAVDNEADDAVSSEEDEPIPQTAPVATALPITSDGRYHNKQRLLLISSRGITARYRHLLEDLMTLAPHAKKESKLDVGKNYSGGGFGAAVNEIAEVRGCHSVMFLECRKRGQDGYLWVGRTSHANSNVGEGDAKNRQLMIGGGPSVKFHITNIHTMDEVSAIMRSAVLPFDALPLVHSRFAHWRSYHSSNSPETA